MQACRSRAVSSLQEASPLDSAEYVHCLRRRRRMSSNVSAAIHAPAMPAKLPKRYNPESSRDRPRCDCHTPPRKKNPDFLGIGPRMLSWWKDLTRFGPRSKAFQRGTCQSGGGQIGVRGQQTRRSGLVELSTTRLGQWLHQVAIPPSASATNKLRTESTKPLPTCWCSRGPTSMGISWRGLSRQ
jgi:hypothetical protein